MIEEWKPVAQFNFGEKYEVSSLGRIRNKTNSKILPQNLSKDKYWRVNLIYNNRKNTYTVHRLVAEAFLGPKPLGYHTCHNNSDKNCNHALNLRYDSPEGNGKDCTRDKTRSHGENHPHTKLSKEDVLQIKQSRDSGKMYSEIAPLFNVSRTCIRNICIGKDWKHDESPKPKRYRGGVKGESSTSAKITENDVKHIRELARDGVSSCEIAKSFPITARSIRRIINRERWAHIL